MRTYRSLSQAELQLSDSEWAELVDFVEEAQQQIASTDGTSRIESYPPKIREPASEAPRFDPGGWVGTYPGTVRVYPGKINQLEYEYLLEDVAGWFELWDLPTAAAVLPMVNAGMIDSRSVIVGYSTALITFTEEALAHRPPTNISRATDTGTRLKGSLNLQETIAAQARGSQKIGYDELHFSLDHPVNLLLIRFHMELVKELDSLVEQSYVMTETLLEQLHYHRGFLNQGFTDRLHDAAIEHNFDDPTVLSQTRRQAPQGLAELVDLWESYLQDQTLSIDFSRQLNIGVKPIEKVYELWILNIILEILAEILNSEPQSTTDDHDTFEFGDRVILYYNKSLHSQSRIINPLFDADPGRPNYALAVDNEIVWVGDAKFRHESTIGLESCQRFLSYVMDLVSPADNPAGSIIYLGENRATPDTVGNDVTIDKLPNRPKRHTTQRKPLHDRLQSCLDNHING